MTRLTTYAKMLLGGMTMILTFMAIYLLAPSMTPEDHFMEALPTVSSDDLTQEEVKVLLQKFRLSYVTDSEGNISYNKEELDEKLHETNSTNPPFILNDGDNALLYQALAKAGIEGSATWTPGDLAFIAPNGGISWQGNDNTVLADAHSEVEDLLKNPELD